MIPFLSCCPVLRDTVIRRVCTSWQHGHSALPYSELRQRLRESDIMGANGWIPYLSQYCER